MKKRLNVVSCLLALVMCLSLVISACANVPDMDDETMNVLLNTLKSTYDGKTSSASYTLPSEMPTTDAKGNLTTVYLSWEVGGTTEIYVSKTSDENVRYRVIFPETIEGAINYTLKVTLMDEKGNPFLDANKQPYSVTLTMTAQEVTVGGNGGSSGGNGGNTGDEGGDSTGGNTGGDNVGGDSTGGTGDNTGGNSGGNTEDNTGDNTGGNTEPTVGDGTEGNPYSVAQALEVISVREQFDYTDKVYVIGVVSGTVSTGSSGDYKFDLVDSDSSASLIVYYASPNGKTVATGDTVVVSGSLVNYNGDSEITAHKDQNKNVVTPCVIESVTQGSGNTGGSGGDNGDDDTGENAGSTLTVVMEEQGFTDKQPVPSSITSNGITIAFSKGTGSTDPSYYLNSAGNALRLYGGNTMTISGKTVTKVEFTFASANDGSNAITANIGTVTSSAWTGSTDNLIFTIGGTTGHRKITKLVITFAD